MKTTMVVNQEMIITPLPWVGVEIGPSAPLGPTWYAMHSQIDNGRHKHEHDEPSPQERVGDRRVSFSAERH